MLRWILPFAGALVLVVILAEWSTRSVRYGSHVPVKADSTITFGATDSVPGVRRISRCVGPRGARCTDSAAATRLTRNRRVEVHYPRELKADESGVVELRYSVSVDSTGGARPASGGPKKKSVTLSGANFVVKPNEQQSVEWSGNGTVTTLWSVLPSRTGSHNLIVNASALYEGGSANVTVVDMRGGSPREINAGQVTLPVDVFTVWGISERVADGAKALLGLVTFALTFFGFAQLRDWIRGRK